MGTELSDNWMQADWQLLSWAWEAPFLPELRPCHRTGQVLPGIMFPLAHMVPCLLREDEPWGPRLPVTATKCVSITPQSVSEVLTVICPV